MILTLAGQVSAAGSYEDNLKQLAEGVIAEAVKAKKSRLAIVDFVDAKGVVDLSKSPGRMELISQIVGLALSPGARLCGALLGPGGKISGQVKTLADKEGEAPAAA